MRAKAVAAGLRPLGLAGLLGVCGAALLGQARAADADVTALPPLGIDRGMGTPSGAYGGAGDLRGLLGNLLGAPAPAEQAFTLTPSIGVQELLTDNVFQASRPRRADLVTSILPQLTLTGQSRLVQADITYAPSVQLYANTGQQDQVAQFFNGQALLTAVPDTLFLQLRAYGTQQAANGNYAQNNLPYNSRSNRLNTTSYEVSPYVTHRFGGDGTVQAGYTLNYTSQSGASATGAPVAGTSLTNTLLAQALGNGTFGNSTTLANEEFASYTTGENLGRFSDRVRLDATQYSATGATVLNGAHQNFFTNDLGYGLNRSVALLGSFGYEDIAYTSIPPVVIQDVTWSAGVRLTPNQNSAVVLKYGHKDGFNALALSASFTLTDRLRVFANYSESLTSSQQELADNLDASTVDQYGNTIGTATGAPTLVSDPLLGIQNGLYRLKRFSATAVTTYDRDVFALTLEQENRRLVASGSSQAAGFGQGGYSDSGFSGSFNWTHEINPYLTGQATLLYSNTTTHTVPSFSTQTAGLVLQTSYAFSPTLSGTLEYFVTEQNSSGAGAGLLQGNQNVLQNALLIGLRKSL